MKVVEQYLKANVLDDYGFSGWIGPEPHGASPSTLAVICFICSRCLLRLPGTQLENSGWNRDEDYADQVRFCVFLIAVSKRTFESLNRR